MHRQIHTLFALIVIEADGTEGIAVEEAIAPPGLPIIGSSLRIVEQRREQLHADRAHAGRRFEVVRFHREPRS